MGFMQMQEKKQTRIKDILENSAKYDTLLGFDTTALLREMENRVVLLFVKLNNIIQMRFDDILESGAKIVFVFYGYNEADDKNYISKHGKEADYTINFSGMRNDNVRFIYYDEEDNKFTLLSGELKETGNNGDNNIYFFESSDFSAQINLVSSYLKFYMDKINFLFLSYNDVHSDNSTKGAGNITCISEECANQEVSTKQCEGEIKVSLTLTGKKETISQLKDLPVYMYIDYSKEIIDSTITLSNEETAQAELGFKTESKSNLILKFSFYRSIYNTIKSSDEIETISHTLHLCKSGSNQYDFNEKFKEKYFPDIIEITGIQLLSYNDKKLEISVLNNVKNTDKKSKDILKYIKWKFFVTDKLVDDKAVEKTAGLADNSITIYELDDKTYNNSVVSGNKLELEYTDKFLELYTTVMNKQNSRQSLVLYPYIAYSELNANKQNQEYLKHALVIRNSGVNKFTGVLSVTISEVQADENGIYVELEAQHDTKLVTPQINDVKWGYLILDKAGILFEKDKIVPMKEISKKIKVYYQEAWYDKYIYFFPYYKSIDTKIYALWHIEQPISLKFNGEKLQIIEDGNIIEEYEARSGQMENRDVAVTNTNVLTQHDNQTVSDNQTQDNNILPLNIVNDNENLKAVHYPGYSAGNTLNIVKNEKFYYDDKATNKIPEGSYYIMANDIKTNPNISKDALNVQGSRYMHMFEHHNIDFTDEKSFNNIITTKDYIMNVTSHHNYFMTSNIIHGGIEYGDKGGIDLSEKADNFFNALNNIRDNTHKDKLYKVYGKVPIKLEVDYRKFYIDEEGYIQGADIKEPILDGTNIKSQLIAKIGNGKLNVINAIILHRTVSYTTKSVFNTWLGKNVYRVGAHFVIDKDGTIYQCLSIYTKAHHVGRIRSKALETNNFQNDVDKKSVCDKKNNISDLSNYEFTKEYPLRFPGNMDSIGIEVVSMYIEQTKQWEKATEAQLKSINLLIDILLTCYKKHNGYNLTTKDIYPHDKIAYKTDGEGGGLYDYKY